MAILKDIHTNNCLPWCIIISTIKNMHKLDLLISTNIYKNAYLQLNAATMLPM